MTRALGRVSFPSSSSSTLTAPATAFRGTHVKTQGIVKGTLTVLPHLPAHLAQGFFKQTGGQQYAVAGRFANEPSKLQGTTFAAR